MVSPLAFPEEKGVPPHARPLRRVGVPAMREPAMPRAFDAVVFDMDGVLTRTAAVHAAAWKRMFDEFLDLRAAQDGNACRAYEHPADYLAHIDGRPRNEGVETFLRSRGISLPPGSPDDAPGFGTVWALGNRKNNLFNEIVRSQGVAVYESTLTLIHALRAEGVRVGLATSSRNAALVLGKSGTAGLFEVVVDGLVSARLGLRGKPAPDIFLSASSQLGVPAGRAIVVEDAVSGVQAGARGGFALTVGVAREDNARELHENGADIVVADLAGITPSDLNRFVLARR